MEEEVRGGKEKKQEKKGMKDYLTHCNINNHLRELNSGAGAKDNDTDKMEEDTLLRKNKSRENTKRKKERKKKKRKEATPQT